MQVVIDELIDLIVGKIYLAKETASEDVDIILDIINDKLPDQIRIHRYISRRGC